MKILLCNDSYPGLVKQLGSALPGMDVSDCAPSAVLSHIADVDVVIPSVAEISKEIIEKGNFGLIQQLGVGVDPVDVEAATAAGIWVANVPSAGSGNAESVAELAILHMLALARRLDEARANVSKGIFFGPSGRCLMNKTVCIVGLGGIGLHLAQRLRPFGVRMVAVRNRAELGAPPDSGIETVFGKDRLELAVADADFVVLALPANDDTQNLFNAEVLHAMKKGSFLINVARGSVVDTNALVEALGSGHLAGAGLDVFTEEPADPSQPLFKQNVIATPHIGGNTDESAKGILKVVIESIKRYANGQPPVHPLNNPLNPRSYRDPAGMCRNKQT